MDGVVIVACVINYMIYYTKYAENKFEILNKHKIFFTREQVEDAIKLPDKVTKKSDCLAARRDKLKVVYKKNSGVIKIITFYPIKNNSKKKNKKKY